MEILAKTVETQTVSVGFTDNARPVARAERVHLAFGGHCILNGVSFDLAQERAVLLRGDNGSGKTTLLNTLSGFLRPDKGQIHLNLNGRSFDAVRTQPERLARAGLGRLWQDIRLFPTMTVLENVLAASAGLIGLNPALALAAWPVSRRQERRAREKAFANLELVGMADRANSSGDKLSVGQMKRVAIARMLQSEAELMLLDEPLAGLDRDSVDGLISLLNRLNQDQGKTLFIVEHQHEQMAPICHETWNLEDGKLHTGLRAHG